jgi:hypothetical protein
MAIANAQITKYKRNVLTALLAECTPEEKEFFKKLYKNPIGPEIEQIHTAINQCENSLLKRGKTHDDIKDILNLVHLNMAEQLWD